MSLVADLAKGFWVYVCEWCCPYREKCGPDTEPYYDTDNDERAAREFCLTRQHFNCYAYVQMEAEAKRKKTEAREKEGGLVRSWVFGDE